MACNRCTSFSMPFSVIAKALCIYPPLELLFDSEHVREQRRDQMKQLVPDLGVDRQPIQLRGQLRVLHYRRAVHKRARAQDFLGDLAAAFQDHLRQALADVVLQADDLFGRGVVFGLAHINRFKESWLTTCSITERTTPFWLSAWRVS